MQVDPTARCTDRRADALKGDFAAADTPLMKLRALTLDLVAKEYAEATASGDFDRAEGWFATAKLVAAREADRMQTNHGEGISLVHVGP